MEVFDFGDDFLSEIIYKNSLSWTHFKYTV